MHKIQEKEFTLEDFSCEHLTPRFRNQLHDVINELNYLRDKYNHFEDEKEIGMRCGYIFDSKKDIWWQMIQLLPSSYNQTRNVMMNYEVLANIYKSRKNHKLDEWREFCKWIESLPYSELITSKKDLVEVTRCKNCSYYISADDMKNDEMYKGYKNLLGCDGICTSTDKWTDETDFCSSGKEK